jgi:hypothetical protein
LRDLGAVGSDGSFGDQGIVAVGDVAHDRIRPRGRVIMEACDRQARAPRRNKRRLPLPRNSRRLEDAAGVVRDFWFEPAGSESSSGVDVAAEATEEQ